VKEDKSLDSIRLWDLVKAMCVIKTRYNWRYLILKTNCKLAVFFEVNYINFLLFFFFLFSFIIFFTFILYKIMQCDIAELRVIYK
jgi:hypothetical protein